MIIQLAQAMTALASKDKFTMGTLINSKNNNGPTNRPIFFETNKLFMLLFLSLQFKDSSVLFV